MDPGPAPFGGRGFFFGPGWGLTSGDDGDPARVALAVGVHALEPLSAPAARELVAALRDRAAERTLLLVDPDRSPLSEAELRALALRALARAGGHVLYGFDPFDYKDRPEWLNPRHWAHPERWDRYRW